MTTAVRSPKVIILTPGQLGSNPRVVKEANALHEAGFEVTVIATKVTEFVEERDQEILETVSWNVERLAFDKNASWRHERLLQEAARKMRRIVHWPLGDAMAHSAMSRRLIRAACRTKADLYIAHYIAALPAAACAARLHGARYAFDAEDFHLGDLPDRPEHDASRTLIRAIEARYLPEAAYVTAASPGIADAYVTIYGIDRPMVIHNVFDTRQAPQAPTPKGSAEGPSLYWFSQTIGPDRGLECALKAISQAQTRPHLYLRGTLQNGYGNRLLALARDLGCADRLHFLAPESPSQMEVLASNYDLGLVGETGFTENRRIALTNKQFTYLLAGVPAVMSDIQAHVAFAKEAIGGAFLFKTDDPVALAARLDELFSDPETLAEARKKAWNLGQEHFNWEIEAPQLLKCVAQAVRSSRLSGKSVK